MKPHWVVFTAAVTLLLFASAAFSQVEQVCADPLDDYVYTGAVDRGGLHLTSEGTIRVLLVFVQLKGDDFLPGSTEWPIDSLPTYFHTFMDSTVDQVSTPGNISDYYRQMSFDKFRLFADPYFVITQHTESYYRDSLGLANPNNAYGKINKEVLQTLCEIAHHKCVTKEGIQL